MSLSMFGNPDWVSSLANETPTDVPSPISGKQSPPPAAPPGISPHAPLASTELSTVSRGADWDTSNIDERIVRALVKQGKLTATQPQAAIMQSILVEGKDTILESPFVVGRTTMAVVLAVQKALESKVTEVHSDSSFQYISVNPSVLIVLPKELLVREMEIRQLIREAGLDLEVQGCYGTALSRKKDSMLRYRAVDIVNWLAE